MYGYVHVQSSNDEPVEQTCIGEKGWVQSTVQHAFDTADATAAVSEDRTNIVQTSVEDYYTNVSVKSDSPCQYSQHLYFEWIMVREKWDGPGSQLQPVYVGLCPPDTDFGADGTYPEESGNGVSLIQQWWNDDHMEWYVNHESPEGGFSDAMDAVDGKKFMIAYNKELNKIALGQGGEWILGNPANPDSMYELEGTD